MNSGGKMDLKYANVAIIKLQFRTQTNDQFVSIAK
jgi:hypothetical protein